MDGEVINKQPGQGITWVISHKLHPMYHFVRFDCNLSLGKSNKIKKKHQMVKDYIKSKEYKYNPLLKQ